MSNFKIFLRDGKLWGNEFPEIPPVSISANQDAARMRSYDRSVESAVASAIEVVGIDPYTLVLNGFIHEEDFYLMPQGWTVELSKELAYTPDRVCYNCLNNRHDLCAAPSTCQCNHIDTPWWKSIARLIPLKEQIPYPDQSNFETEEEYFEACRKIREAGIVATGIPEHGDKFEVLLYGEWVELSENQYLQAINNNHYGRVNGIEQHRKPVSPPPKAESEDYEAKPLLGDAIYNALMSTTKFLPSEATDLAMTITGELINGLSKDFTITRKP